MLLLEIRRHLMGLFSLCSCQAGNAPSKAEGESAGLRMRHTWPKPRSTRRHHWPIGKLAFSETLASRHPPFRPDALEI